MADRRRLVILASPPRGRYVIFLDDDDLITPDRLEMALSALDRAPVSICWTAFIEARDSLDRAHGRILEGDVRGTILEGLVPNVGATALQRELVPRFDEHMRTGEDIEWWLRLAHVAQVTTSCRVGHLYRRHLGPRNKPGPAGRARSHQQVLARHPQYFASHPRSAAFRWKRIGLLAMAGGDHGLARQAFIRSARLRPAPSTLRHLARAMTTP